MDRVANLPPEMPAEVIQRITHKLSNAQEIIDEKWPNAYRHKGENGIRLATTNTFRLNYIQADIGYKHPTLDSWSPVLCVMR
jgi:hypothetical protein